MKHPYSLRAACAALVLGAVAAPAAFAQSTTNASSSTAPVTTSTTPAKCWHHHHHLGVLTATERAELKKDKASVLAANPSLQTAHNNLKQQCATLRANKATATQAQWQALHQQATSYHQQLRSAILLMDPSASAIFSKIDAARAAHHS